MHTVKHAVRQSELTGAGWFSSMVKVIRSLKAQGVPVIGTASIRVVEWGTLTQYPDGPDYVFEWRGDTLKDFDEQDLI